LEGAPTFVTNGASTGFMESLSPTAFVIFLYA
jgi:hypothetical protein